MTAQADTVTELVLRLLLRLVGQVSVGHEVVSRLTGGLTWSLLVWVLAGALLVSLAAGAWTAFWDD